MLTSDQITEKVNRLREITEQRPTEELQKETLKIAFDLLESFLTTQQAIHTALTRI